jgi:hypothetical protein
MNARIPEPVRPVLDSYVASSDKLLPGLIRAFYVVGSIALDGFSELFSDVDFVAVLNRKASPQDIASLKAIHRSIKQQFPEPKLSGSYLQPDDLGHFANEIARHPYYHDGRFHKEGCFEINSVTWWILKNRGVAVLGADPTDLPFTVDWNLLVSWMRENLNSYWMSWTKRLDGFLVMLSDWGIQWTILGVSRQYYTLRENSITTKIGAAAYALTCVPARWHPLIREAIEIREGHEGSHYSSRFSRMIDSVKFLKYVIQVCNAEFQ